MQHDERAENASSQPNCSGVACVMQVVSKFRCYFNFLSLYHCDHLPGKELDLTIKLYILIHS